MAKTWEAFYKGRKITVEHRSTLSQKTQIRIFVDGNPIVETPLKYTIGRSAISSSFNFDESVETLKVYVTYSNNGLRRIAQISVDGKILAGPEILEDFYDERFPRNGATWHFLHRGAPAGLLYVFLMSLLSQTIDLMSLMILFSSFSLLMGLTSYGISRIAHKES